MWIKINVLKNLLKSEYKKAGLEIHNIADHGIWIQGSNWLMFFYGGIIPKEIKGELIKLVGDLPKEGQAFRINEDGNQIVMDVVDNSVLATPESEWNITPISYELGGMYKVIENAKTKEKKMILAAYTNIVDLKLLDKGEPAPEGPYMPKGLPGCVAWDSDDVLYATYITDVTSNKEASELLNALKDVNCNK